MIVWGGDNPPAFPDLGTGGRYSPSSDTWTATGIVGAPPQRGFHTAVWTGTQMIVWGGSAYQGTVRNDGGRYTPSTDTWMATSIGTNLPTARYGHTAIWTGGVMVIWGGQGNDSGTLPLNSGGRYTPATDSWIATGTGLNLPSARSGHTAVWKPIGTEMIVWGGEDASGTPLNTGGRYNMSNNQWLATNAGVTAPSARTGHVAVWNASGTEMIVWGGEGASGALLNTGGRYNLANNQWTATSTGANVPSPRSLHTAVWTGAEMIVWGGFDGSRDVQSGGRYNPSTDAWVVTASSFSPEGPTGGQTTVWTGAEMIVWGGTKPFGMGSLRVNTGWRYNASTDTWAATSTGGNVPSAREDHTAVWTGTEMIVWGGADVGDSNTGGRYNPSTDGWAATSTAPYTPSPRSRHTAVWTGTEMIVWGGAGDNTGGRYNPSTDGWTATSGTNTPSVRLYHTAVWTGTEMIVWGGVDGTYANTGGRYSPSTDTWSATSTGTNTPSGRLEHTAVWTGTEMIVWGASGLAAYDTGGRYNPLTDAWTPTSIGANVPAGRALHSAVWTGTEMIVWGGTHLTSFNDGGRYSPSTDSWTRTSVGANVPSPRRRHSAVWTGEEMIVWGASSFPGLPGGRYCVDICGPSVSCGDGNSCTTDSCDSATGCVFSINSDPCSDGDGCTTNDTCGGGICNGGTVITAPPEIQNIAVAADKATYGWPAATYATRYDVARGGTGAFPVGPGGDDEVCFDNLLGTTLNDPAVPDPGTGFWYLARGANACGTGSYGTEGEHGTPGAERVTATCP